MLTSLAIFLITLITHTSALVASPAPHILTFTTQSDILCYDTRYATHHPPLDDCSEVLTREIATPHMTRPITFSRHPIGDQFRLPHTFKTARGACAVVIDMPMTPTHAAVPPAEASMLDVKAAAFAVLKACVAHADGLGGIVQTGLRGDLQVRVAAPDPR